MGAGSGDGDNATNPTSGPLQQRPRRYYPRDRPIGVPFLLRPLCPPTCKGSARGMAKIGMEGGLGVGRVKFNFCVVSSAERHFSLCLSCSTLASLAPYVLHAICVHVLRLVWRSARRSSCVTPTPVLVVRFLLGLLDGDGEVLGKVLHVAITGHDTCASGFRRASNIWTRSTKLNPKISGASSPKRSFIEKSTFSSQKTRKVRITERSWARVGPGVRPIIPNGNAFRGP